MGVADIPIIDLAPFLDGDAGQDAVVQSVAAACGSSGFFLVTGHGVPESATSRLAAAARAFFDRPESEKQQTTGHSVPGGLSFAGLGTEALAATQEHGGTPPADVKESLNFGPSLPGAPWPTDLAALQPAFTECFRAMETLAHALRRLFCAAIGLTPEYFEPDFAGHLSALRVINYPEPSAPPLPGQLRAGAHTDYGFLTILRSEASAGGLQLRHRDGTWLDAPTQPGAFVVNIGDALMRWTNGAWRSTPHRVANPSADRRAGSRRQSIAFFHNPNAAALLTCLEPFRRPGAPEQAPLRYGDYIALKTRQAFPPGAQKELHHDL